jgi:hypothetical protein
MYEKAGVESVFIAVWDRAQGQVGHSRIWTLSKSLVPRTG